MGQNKSLHANKCAHMVIAKSNPFCLRSKQRLLFVVWMALIALKHAADALIPGYDRVLLYRHILTTDVHNKRRAFFVEGVHQRSQSLPDLEVTFFREQRNQAIEPQMFSFGCHRAELRDPSHTFDRIRSCDPSRRVHRVHRLLSEPLPSLWERSDRLQSA